MWILTRFGFFSVVRKPSETNLTVRSRVRADLERLREHLPELGPVREGEGTDYPFRASAPPEAVGRAFGVLFAGIDYSNFKAEVGRTLGVRRERVYSDVWSALRRLENHGGSG